MLHIPWQTRSNENSPTRILADYPLYVISGLAMQDILNKWWWDTAQTLAMVAIFSVTTILFAWLLTRSTVARLGGDEFVVLLPKLEKDTDALAVAEKIRTVISQPFIFAEVSFDISASIGVAIYAAHGDDEKTLTRNADIAMYHAKKNGRDRVVLYQSGMQQG